MSIQIRSTLRDVPIRAVIYGADGVGKSTFCAGAPGACFIPVEEGIDNIDTMATPRPETWGQIVEYANALADDDRCKSLVIDSLDEAEQKCWEHLCRIGDGKRKNLKSIKDFGWGDGYKAAVSEWRILISALERAGNAGKNVLLIAHAHRKSVKNPSGEDYEQWQIKLHDSAASLFREWSHTVAFAELDIATVTDKDDGGRTKGIFSGKRVLRTAPSAGYQGKTRIAMAAKTPLDWASFVVAIEAGKVQQARRLEDLEIELERKMRELDDADVTMGCAGFLVTNGRTTETVIKAIETVQGYLDERSAVQ